MCPGLFVESLYAHPAVVVLKAQTNVVSKHQVSVAFGWAFSMHKTQQ